MRSHRVAVGLLLLLVAGALGLGTLHEQNDSRTTDDRDTFRSANFSSERRALESTPRKITPHPAHYQRVEPLPPAGAEDLAQARQTESYARRRLAELTARLDLSRRQQNDIFPLLVRSSPHYDESLRLVGTDAHPGFALSRNAAENQIHSLLDPYQQVEHELAEAEKNIWWTDVISRLEEDLHNSTQDLPAAGSDPEPDDPGNPPAPPVHGGGNLFDQLNQE